VSSESGERDARRLSLWLSLAVSLAWWTGIAEGPAAAQPVSKSTVELGLKISPVPVALNGKDRDRIGWGSYLVNAVSDCGGCHTFPQFLPAGDPFQGTSQTPITPVRNTRHYFAGGFCVGKVISSNITPDLDTGLPANMTLHQFTTAMRSGKGNSSNLLHVMPWPAYRNMTDDDIAAIYQY
jgi:hypothetical protein